MGGEGRRGAGGAGLTGEKARSYLEEVSVAASEESILAVASCLRRRLAPQTSPRKREPTLACEMTMRVSPLGREIWGWPMKKLENTREVNGSSGKFGDLFLGRENTLPSQEKPLR